MDEELVLVNTEDAIVTLTLNRPDALNALSSAMRRAIVSAFENIKNDESVRAVVLTGAGRAFCAGLDLFELASGESDNEEAVSDANLQKAVMQCGKPVIGAINGFAITGGFELALMTDFMIASEDARFADTHAQVGVVPGWGLSQKLPRLVGINRAKELSLTGNFLDAVTAEKWGLVNRVVPAGQLMEVATGLARDIASTDRRTMQTIHEIIDAGWNTTLEEGLRIEARANREHMQSVTPDFLEERRRIVMDRGKKQNR